ncbi:hypothetical protein EJ08DRAFT_695311 [Tothia fuscella]|uniref:Uncharacterized protein n=1 Tax=Tothia fuscella TaxID=1048955 RepID=A0A9P4NUL1_9PEZI|nr:hypothetical protein EJ08DRAFT_695311 [Tothia fuscella]
MSFSGSGHGNGAGRGNGSGRGQLPNGIPPWRRNSSNPQQNGNADQQPQINGEHPQGLGNVPPPPPSPAGYMINPHYNPHSLPTPGQVPGNTYLIPRVADNAGAVNGLPPAPPPAAQANAQQPGLAIGHPALSVIPARNVGGRLHPNMRLGIPMPTLSEYTLNFQELGGGPTQGITGRSMVTGVAHGVTRFVNAIEFDNIEYRREALFSNPDALTRFQGRAVFARQVVFYGNVTFTPQSNVTFTVEPSRRVDGLITCESPDAVQPPATAANNANPYVLESVGIHEAPVLYGTQHGGVGSTVSFLGKVRFHGPVIFAGTVVFEEVHFDQAAEFVHAPPNRPYE